jgi:hypothetical protein
MRGGKLGADQQAADHGRRLLGRRRRDTTPARTRNRVFDSGSLRAACRPMA